MNRIFSSKSAIRFLRVAAIVGVVGLGADVGAAAAKALLSKPDAASVATSVSSVKPFILALDSAPETKAEAARQDCREVAVETDEGYGVRGTVIRTVCRNVL
ncbi:hypothetical protein WOC76_13035 [Methylocystis sp. IM3]|uniref:hypothetical protein n=1 Tax=Methylocystis sp. IM3 TaxID=3136722 RepID=UPI00311A3344